MRSGRMRIALVAMLTGAAASAGAAEATVADRHLAADIAASRATAASFAQALQGELKAAMAAGGPVAAIEVCSLRAPEIARQQSAAEGGTVGRTSLRTRNPGNAADAWEQAQLVRFEERRRAGEDAATIEVAEVVVGGDAQPVFRYMKAIPTGEACLACHGANPDAAVAARLAALYPDDQARGYALGDLRGAFTITRPLRR